ncbi:MAG: 4Fe-4S dicluster domain-containing protein, partial [Chloroflexi bacterium]|nr:4Fe-4S dicluster domain-containing protein [Chloroflexota bacterium]
HVAFIEQFPKDAPSRWLMMSDVCKHCALPGCMEACPTGAIIRTEFDSVYVQQDVCNGCGYCVPACPFGVIDLDYETDGKAHKCTLCYDRLKGGMEPACAKACPTDSIVFGPLEDLRKRAERRVETLHERGIMEAYHYGDDTIVGGLNCSFILTDRPEVYNLPPQPKLPSGNAVHGAVAAIAAGILLLAGAALIFARGGRSHE